MFVGKSAARREFSGIPKLVVVVVVVVAERATPLSSPAPGLPLPEFPRPRLIGGDLAEEIGVGGAGREGGAAPRGTNPSRLSRARRAKEKQLRRHAIFLVIPLAVKHLHREPCSPLLPLVSFFPFHAALLPPPSPPLRDFGGGGVQNVRAPPSPPPHFAKTARVVCV
uniref:Uncharacterized protein n=1 Tax=Ixodes ricinus TaxID=34613 RepID=A0A6B0UYM9_IXORI